MLVTSHVRSALCTLPQYHKNYNLIFSILGFEYTNKLQRMFQDVGVSKDLNEQFRTHLQSGGNDPLDIDFQIQVKQFNLIVCSLKLF